MIQRMLKRSMGDVVEVKRRETKNLYSVEVIAETIKEGDYLALVDNQLFGTEKDLDAILDKLANEANDRDGEFINIFYGEGVDKAAAEAAAARFEAICPDAEISVLEGGQPVYHYLISVE